MFWRVYYQPKLSLYEQSIVKNKHIFISMKFVDRPMPHIVLWDGHFSDVQEIADELTARNFDVVTIQKEEGTP